MFIAVECEAGPDDVLLCVWAASPERARTVFDRLHKRFFRPRAQIGAEEAEFSVISIRMGDPYLRPVRVTPSVRTAAGLVLHYGEEFERWHRDFCDQLKRRTSGVTILQGPPGTGKTTYLRHLLFELKATHRFYYLPLTSYSMLCSPDCIEFWLRENKRNLGKVVVIEDAESLLAKRGADNQEALSNLLNIADGFIGDYLRLHVICTISAPIKDLDPAVTRPGRLIASREFSKLTRQQALRLAETLGITLQPQDSYSLAEIYNKSDLDRVEATGRVGFAAK
jgi:ATPase family associated with various cellular activities (AAA)